MRMRIGKHKWTVKYGLGCLWFDRLTSKHNYFLTKKRKNVTIKNKTKEIFIKLHTIIFTVCHHYNCSQNTAGLLFHHF